MPPSIWVLEGRGIAESIRKFLLPQSHQAGPGSGRHNFETLNKWERRGKNVTYSDMGIIDN